MILFNVFGAKDTQHSVGRPLGLLSGVQVTFQESILRLFCHKDNTPTAMITLGVLILLEVLAFPQLGGFDEQFMGQSTEEGALEAGRGP